MTDADKTRIEIEKEPYFHLSKNEHGNMWLMYNPEGNGRYKCWEPIPQEFWNEFEKLQSATVWAERLNKQHKEDQAMCEKWKQSAETLTERLKQERNKAIDLCLMEFVKWLTDPTTSANVYTDRLESLKSKPE